MRGNVLKYRGVHAPRTPNFPLYHILQILSIDILHKSFSYWIPKFVQLAQTQFRLVQIAQKQADQFVQLFLKNLLQFLL